MKGQLPEAQDRAARFWCFAASALFGFCAIVGVTNHSFFLMLVGILFATIMFAFGAVG